MFYEVRVLDRKGKIKKVLSSKSLSKRYWDSFFDGSGPEETPKKSKTRTGFNSDGNSKVGYKNLYIPED